MASFVRKVSDSATEGVPLSPPPLPNQTSGPVSSRTTSKSEDRNLSKVTVDPERWRFSRDYRRYKKNAWKNDGKGYLQKECTVTVYDYGQLDGKAPIHRINGRCGNTSCLVVVRSVEELLQSFPRNFFEELPAWCKVRWIDVEGVNGEIVQFCLHLIKCERHYAFNTLVDRAQRPMGLILDSDGDDTNFMLVTQVADLSKAADNFRKNELESLYEFPPKTAIVDYEQVSYLLHLPEVDIGSYGMLISIQQGKEGDPYGGVRQEIMNGADLLYTRCVQHLFMKLVDASSDRLWGIQHFIEGMLVQLDHDMDQSICDRYFAYAQSIASQCHSIVRALQPFEASIKEFLALREADLMTGKAKPAWRALSAQLKRFLENIQAQENRAEAIVGRYRDAKQRQEEERQRRIEQSQRVMTLILSVFSPLSFITGVFGMNFALPDGSMAIPTLKMGYELENPNDPTSALIVIRPTGYEYFWIVCSIIIVVIISSYMLLGLLMSPKAILCCVKKTFKSEARKIVPFNLKVLEDASEGGEEGDTPGPTKVIYVQPTKG